MDDWRFSPTRALLRQLGQRPELLHDYLALIERLMEADDPTSSYDFNTVPAIANPGELPPNTWIAELSPGSGSYLTYAVDPEGREIKGLQLD